METDNIFCLNFRRISSEDMALLGKWYGMTNDFGYATGFKSFSEIKQILAEAEPENKLVLMIETREGKKTVGFIHGEFKMIETNFILWIYILIIDPAFQRKGLGTCAVKKLLDVSKRQYGALACFVSVSDKNIPGLSFWKKSGFIHADRMEESLNQKRSSDVAILIRKI